jgi:hypothetical protein
VAKEVDPIAALRGKSWEELEALEAGDRVLFPDQIRFRDRRGALREIDIAVRVLRAPERRKARVEARKRAVAEGLDLDRDADQCDVLDRLHQLAFAIREAKPPHEQHATPEMLEGHYDLSSLDELWERYQVYEERQDPRLDITDEATMWAAIGAVAKAGNPLPLAGLASRFQQSCIVFMARASLLSPTFKSFLDSIDSSTPRS